MPITLKINLKNLEEIVVSAIRETKNIDDNPIIELSYYDNVIIVAKETIQQPSSLVISTCLTDLIATCKLAKMKSDEKSENTFVLITFGMSKLILVNN